MIYFGRFFCFDQSHSGREILLHQNHHHSHSPAHSTNNVIVNENAEYHLQHNELIITKPLAHVESVSLMRLLFIYLFCNLFVVVFLLFLSS